MSGVGPMYHRWGLGVGKCVNHALSEVIRQQNVGHMVVMIICGVGPSTRGGLGNGKSAAVHALRKMVFQQLVITTSVLIIRGVGPACCQRHGSIAESVFPTF